MFGNVACHAIPAVAAQIVWATCDVPSSVKSRVVRRSANVGADEL